MAVSKKLSSISKVLLAAEAFPKPVRAMLSQKLDLSLGVCKEERHEYQERFVQMVGEVLRFVEADLQENIQAAETKVAVAADEKVRRAAEAEAAAATVAEKTEAVAAAKLAASEATTKTQAAAAALELATGEQKLGDQSLEVANAKKEKLESCLANFVPSCSKEAIAAIMKVGKEFHFDTALLTSLPSAMGKTLEARGNFDTLVIGQAEGEINKHLAIFVGQLTEGEPDRAARAEKVSAAAAELGALSKIELAFKTSLKEAQSTQHEAENAQKARTRELKQFGPEMKQLEADLISFKDSLEELRAGALADFKELAERSNLPPEPVPVAETEPPAEAEVATTA